MGGVRSRPIGTSDSLSDGNGSILNNQNQNTIQKSQLHHQISPQSSIIYSNHIRQPSVRSRSSQPMPGPSELDRRFAKVLVCN